ncbi:hypothetical protein B0H10DRAFT_1767803, partial [Mycena sp. CBHHK59/15]
TPPPLQCFHCQVYGHMAKACSDSKDPATIKCARCAGSHATRDCECPNTPRCANTRTCTHIMVKCANCGGPHKSFANSCPVKV